jgi:ribose-phosphate pyrophosphokinase
MTPTMVALPGNERLATTLARTLPAAEIPLEVRRFPDGESLVRIAGDVRGRDVVIVATLDQPDAKIVPLLLASGAARDLGAARVLLLTPYLGYLRQDAAFRPGEAVSARIIGRLLSAWFDAVIVAEPHVHRIESLSDLFEIPAIEVHVDAAIARYVAASFRRPLVVGPDLESGPWAEAVARHLGAPWIALRKMRHGDREVTVEAPDLSAHAGCTPVIVDDIVSTGRTMAQATRALLAAGLAKPTCIAVHAVFADDVGALLAQAGAARLVTTNTVPHRSNGIDVTDDLAAGVREALTRARHEAHLPS